MATLNIRKLAASVVIVALGGALAAACGGGGAETTGGTTSGSEKPNGGTLNPPPIDDGTGKPSNATSFTCQVADECGNWFCDCSDGFVVNSAFCKNGYCLDAAGACSNACKTNLWDHGTWTGTAGGGPGGTSVTTSTTGGDGAGGGGVGGSDGSGGFGGGGPDPVCLESGATCSEPQECCSFDCYFGTCT
jgi:hypothetical protein